MYLHENESIFLLQIDYVSLADVRIIKHGHSNLATVVASSDALVTPTKATNRSTDALVTPTKATNNCTVEKHVGNQTPVGSSKPQKEGHTPAKGNVHFTILKVHGLLYINMKTS